MYAKIIITIFILIILMDMGKRLCYRELTSPQVLSAFSFIPSLIFLIFYANKWEADLNELTITLIILNPFVFFVFAFVSKFFYVKKVIKKRCVNRIDNIHSANVLFMTFIEIISLFLLLRYAISFVGSFSNLSALLMSYRYKSDYVQQADLPAVTSLFRLVTVYSGYLWGYLICINIIEKKQKNSKLYIINFLLSIVASLCSGARGTSVMLLISFLIQYLLLSSRKTKLEEKNSEFIAQNKKKIFVLFAGLLILATQFDKFANLLGRDTSDFTGMYYLAVYLSAPIKNLDSFLIEGCNGFVKNIWDTHTLSQLAGYIGPKYFNKYPESFIYPFKEVNGVNLGNVATAYANMYYDGGLIFFVLFSAIMAFFCIIVYRKSMESYSNYVKEINVYIIAYSIMAFGVLFNFFANEFYNSVANIDFIRGVIVIIAIKFFLERVKIYKR